MPLPSVRRRADPLRGARLSISVAALLPLAAAACQTAPRRVVPDPLPETLEWALPASDGSAFLGLEVRENDSGSLESLSFDPGVRVHRVVARSPAESAGLRTDDVLLSFEDVELAVPDDLSALLDRASGGQRVTLGVQRGDTVFDVELDLGGENGSGATSATEAFVLDPARTLGAWGTNDGAVLVARNEDGPARGLELGSRVVSLDGDPIVSGRGLVRRLVAREPGTRVTLGVVEPGDVEPRDVTVHLLSEGRRTTRFSVPVVMTYDAEADGTRTDFVLIDLYLISLVRYAREGNEKRWRLLRFFQWSSGVGELDE